jgi:opacity protein-like surface antigen
LKGEKHMKNTLLILVCIICLYGAADYAQGYDPLGDWTGNLNFMLGAKVLEEDDWDPVDRQSELGILIDFKQLDWPVSIAIDLLTSIDRRSFFDPFWGFTVNVEGSTFETNLGVRTYIHPREGMNIYFGGGVALVSAKIRVSDAGWSESDTDSEAGFWLNFGITWSLGETRAFNIGFDLRHSNAEAEMFGYRGESGGFHYGLILGYHW